MNKERPEDPSMARVRAQFEQSGLSLHALGVRMGYPEVTARKSAWQFIQKTYDPRISMLRRFARAMDVSLAELLPEEKKNSRSK